MRRVVGAMRGWVGLGCLVGFAAAVSLAGCTYDQPRRATSKTTGAPTAASSSYSSGSGPRLTAMDTAGCRGIVHDDSASESLRQAAARNLEYLSRQPSDKRFKMLDREVSALELTSMSQAVSTQSGDDWGSLCDRYRLYKVEVPDGLLVTGYYQPELNASRKKTSRFRYPVYRTPDDLVDVDLREFCADCPAKVVQGRVKGGTLARYYTRAEIEAGALSGHDQELAWLDDPVEAYFLGVQGSALLRLEDGVLLQISYSSSNGWPYTALGKVLMDQGKISRDALSLQTLKNYLRAHPDEQASLMATNQRYVFFRGVVTGPIGSCGVPLTGGRSVAVDPSVYAHGALGFLHINPRSDAATAQRPYSRLVMLQDAGNAISGPGRLDVYWGSGEIAEDIAGDMRNSGDLYVFLPN